MATITKCDSSLDTRCVKFGAELSNESRVLSGQSEIIQNRSVYAEDADAFLGGGLQFDPASTGHSLAMLLLQTRHELLTIDSVNLALVRRARITEVATANESFNFVRGVIVCKPQDIT